MAGCAGSMPGMGWRCRLTSGHLRIRTGLSKGIYIYWFQLRVRNNATEALSYASPLNLRFFLVLNHFEWFGDYSVWSCLCVCVSVRPCVCPRTNKYCTHILMQFQGDRAKHVPEKCQKQNQFFKILYAHLLHTKATTVTSFPYTTC